MALASLAGISFTLHLIWERSHIHLYTGYEALEGMLPVFVYATIGDVLYTFLAVFLFALFKRKMLWFVDARASDYLLLALLGFFIALGVEYKAALLDRWEYTDAMPLLYGFGLSPLIQMTVLLPLSVYISARLGRLLMKDVS